jgi:hypothetical protein
MALMLAEPLWPAHPRPLLLIRPAWTAHAACRGAGADSFHRFGATGALAAALATCDRCAVRVECLGYALGVEQPGWPQGIWGATTPAQRKPLLKLVAAGADPATVAAEHFE